MVPWIVIKSFAGSHFWGVRPSHEIMWLKFLVSSVADMISLIIIVFENFTAKLVISDLTISSVSPSDKRLNVVRLRDIVHRQLLMELVWTHIACSQLPDGVTHVLLLLVGELGLSSQMNIWCSNTSKRCHLMIDRSILILPWSNIHVSEIHFAFLLIFSLLGQVTFHIVCSNQRCCVMCCVSELSLLLWLFYPPPVSDWRLLGLIWIHSFVSERLIEGMRVLESVATGRLVAVIFVGLDAFGCETRLQVVFGPGVRDRRLGHCYCHIL